MASLLYNSGLRLLECIRLRVRDIDLETGQILLLEDDQVEGQANVFLPDALKRRYPNASYEWAWQWVFPAARMSSIPRTGQVRHHHPAEDSLQCAVKTAIQKAGIAKH